MSFDNLDQKVSSRITSALRQVWRFYHKPRKQALELAKIGRGQYRCSCCHGTFTVKDLIVDHIETVVPLDGKTTAGDFVDRLFCGIDNLQILCKECSKVKTNEENAIRRVIKRLKESVNQDRLIGQMENVALFLEGCGEADEKLDCLRICKIKKEDWSVYEMSSITGERIREEMRGLRMLR